MTRNIPIIDLAWETVNALGGSAEQDNSYDQGFVDAIGKALEAIEKLVGKDPLPQRSIIDRRKHNAKHPLPVTFE
jgi:hypothetical protein